MAEAAKPWEKYAQPAQKPWERFGAQFKKSSFAPPFEAAAQMASATIAEPIAGLAGIAASAIPGGRSGGQMVRDVQSAMTYQPRTEEGKAFIPEVVQGVVNATPEAIKAPIREGREKYAELERWTADNYGPAAAAAVATLPAAILEAIPAGLAARKFSRANAPEPPNPRSTAPNMEMPADPGQHQQIGADMRRGNASRVAPAVNPDMQILKDAEDLGIDLNPSHYSTNRAYVDMEQALKSRPGSLLQTAEERAIINLGNKADELIDSLGGAQDKSTLDAAVFDNFNETITGLNRQSDLLYDKVNTAIPRATKVMPQAATQYIQQQIADLGGDQSLLTAAERDLKRLVDGAPTYAALDRVRKDIGSAIGSRSGVFKDDNVGQLKKLYEVLSVDQQRFADAFGVGDVLKDAQALIVQRKRLEDQAVNLFGREAQKSIIPRLRQSATGLTQGDVSKLNNMMESVPEALRPDVAATLLNDLFSAGARRNAPIGQGFVNAFMGLNRNQGAKSALFKYLPPDAKERFDKIGRVATGIYRAKALENTSRSARDVIAAMDDGGLLSRVYGIGKKVVAAESITTPIGIPGTGAAGVLGSILSSKASKATQAADELITSPAFKEAVIEAAGTAKAKQERLMNSPAYNKWLDAQNPSIKKEIAAIGFIPWLTGGPEREAQSQGQQ
jgi:hypothetical protein